MFPSLRFMLAAVLSTLVILVIASSALVSTRRLEMPMVLHPPGSRPLVASWMTDDSQSFEARFGPQAMMINASVQLPPTDRSRPVRIEFVASANAASDPTNSVDPAKPADRAIPNEAAAAPPTSAPAPAPAEEPLAISPPVAIALLPERPASPPAAAATKVDPPIIVAAIEPAPVPAKDPQVASDAPAQPDHRIAVAPPAAPTAERPTFVDTSRTEPIAKPAVKRRAQIKRPKRRIVRPAKPAPVAAKPSAQTAVNPFAALFTPNATH